MMENAVEAHSGGSLVRCIEKACLVNFHMVLLITGCSNRGLDSIGEYRDTERSSNTGN
jgi:hypothetical protein